MPGPKSGDVVTDEVRFFHVAHDEVVPSVKPPDLRCGRARLFVRCLAVNQGGVAVLRVRLDSLPHVEHRAARGVHHDTADLAERLEIPDGDAESRQDNDVRGPDVGVFEPRLGRRRSTSQRLKDRDPHLHEPVIHVRVVDDLADEEDPPIGKLPARLVRVFHRAFNAVAESELARQPHGNVAQREREITLAEKVDDPSRIVGDDVILDLGLQPEALPIIRLGQCTHEPGI